MDINLNRSQLLSALQSLRFYFGSNNEWPFVSFAPDADGNVMVYALLKSGAAVTCCWLPFEGDDITETSGFTGSMVEALVKSVSSEYVRLRATDSNLFIEGTDGFKGRLARSTAMPSMADPILTKKSQMMAELSATLPKDNLERLLSLSAAFPGVGVNELRWCALSFGADDDCSGSVQKSELGEIEAMPMHTSTMVGKGTLYFYTALVKYAQSLAREFVSIQAGADRKSAILVSDPEVDSWWTMIAPIRLPGEE